MARRRAIRIVGAIVAVVVVAAAATTWFVTRPSAAEAAGCGPVQSVAPYPDPQNKGLDRAHIGAQSSAGGEVQAAPPLSTYSSTPPASGPHDPNPLGAGVYPSPPDIYRTIHSLEHGAVIIWYDPAKASASQLTTLRRFYEQGANIDHVIVAPYSYPDQGDAGRLPAGKAMVLVAWHHVQSCDSVSLPVARSFVRQYRYDPAFPNAYKGDAPEAGAAI